MAGVCSPVRRAGRLHFIGRHLEDRHYDPPQFEVGSARHRRGHSVAYRWPAGMPASTATKPPPEPGVQRLTFRSGGLPRRLWYFWYAHAEYRLP